MKIAIFISLVPKRGRYRHVEYKNYNALKSLKKDEFFVVNIPVTGKKYRYTFCSSDILTAYIFTDPQVVCKFFCNNSMLFYVINIIED